MNIKKIPVWNGRQIDCGWIVQLDAEERNYILALLIADSERLNEESDPENYPIKVCNQDLLRDLL